MGRAHLPRPAACFAELPLLSETTLRQLRIAGLSDSEVQNLVKKLAALAAAAVDRGAMSGFDREGE